MYKLLLLIISGHSIRSFSSQDICKSRLASFFSKQCIRSLGQLSILSGRLSHYNLKFLHKEPTKRCYDIKPTIFYKFTLLKATCFLKKEIISIISIKLVEQQIKFLKFQGWQQAGKNSWLPSPPPQTFPLHLSHSFSPQDLF